ncbi:hypothetical protein [Methylorubrum extorquens]|jgi:hypothetical protein|uniref:hypothetical protein n=1 Tax=Methylorubrum extorquens TaxID=408 RepID=UPI0006F5DC15|nr:hypothetical protein [Methylorubrum extorquens]KQO99326.1 hypothetical protein ASF33_06745 [Methylobacterium sp. Leaf92]UYW32658.1 hypothetical protein OKB92_00580 [Methylorubrum extorquens]
MPTRSEVVEMMLMAARQIAVREAFAEDAVSWMSVLERAENEEGALELRARVISCKAETAIMREAMDHLACILSDMPIETT